MNDLFRKFAHYIAQTSGNPYTFICALTLIILWALTGPYFEYSNTWQLVINTTTTIVTFLMVFLIQNTQNRDSKAVQLKLDELIRAVKGARDSLVDLEDLTDPELEALHKQFQQIHERYYKEVTRRKTKQIMPKESSA